MTDPARVDFYILADDKGVSARYRFVCRLVEKAYHLDNRVYIHADDETMATELDTLLWTYRDASFVPHARLPVADGDISPVLIGYGEHWTTADLLINLQETVPTFYDRFPRIAEVVDQRPDILASSRQRFRHYRKAGMVPTSHKI